MADFRKVSVLASLVLTLGVTGFAADSFSCNNLNGNPTLVRGEGYTELMGDIVASCTGGTPTATGLVPQVNFVIYLNTNITSRTYNAAGVSEALLLIDNPTSANLRGCANSTGCTYAGGLTDPNDATKKNVFRGVVAADGSSVSFVGVPLDPPGTTGSRIYRFVNIRANANKLFSETSSLPNSIQAILTATGTANATAPFSTSAVTVGWVVSGMTFSAAKNTATSTSFSQCNAIGATNTKNSFQLGFTEGFPTAFKTRGKDQLVANRDVTTAGIKPQVSQDIPGNIYNTESGFYHLEDASYGGLYTATTDTGIATSGTRLKAVFSNIPTGVSVYVSTTLFAGTSGTSYGVLVPGESGELSAQTSTTSGLTVGANFGGTTTSGYQLTVSNNTATAVWEVTTADPVSTDTYTGLAFFGYASAPASNIPAVGTGLVSGGFAPTPSGLGVSASVATAPSQTLSIPRFADTRASNSNKTALSIYACRTSLLFPFVTNQSGFDTGIAIANTTTDPFNTVAQAGPCTLYSYGAEAQASIVTPSVATGTVYTNLASIVLPNFQGYVIAQCNFQYAHGFAFISDFGSRNLAMGYLALILPETTYNTRSAVEALDN
jgi:hypothetical protein